MTEQTRESFFENYYNGQAEYWDWLYTAPEEELSIYAYHFRKRREVILDRIAGHRAGDAPRFLDAGCGPGAYSNVLLKSGYDVFGFDQSEKMVETATKNVEEALRDRATFRVGNLDKIGYEDNYFDVIINVAVLMYVSDPERCIAEIARVLKPGGLCIITVDSSTDFADKIDFVARFRRLFGKLKRKSADLDTVHTDKPAEAKPASFSPAELRAMGQKAGLVETGYTSIGYGPILVNSKRVFSDRADMRIDRALSFLRKLPVTREWGYTYIWTATKPE